MAKKSPKSDAPLSRREREVMNVLFQRGSATAREVWTALGENRTYSTIRKILSILEEKGHVGHRTEGATFVYSPSVKPEVAAKSAVSNLVDVFFQGSIAGAVSSLLGEKGHQMTDDELDEIERLIEEARNRTEDA